MKVPKRKTKQRELIRSALSSADGPLSPSEILELSKEDCPSISLATVYRALKSLLKDEEVVSVPVPGEPDRYETAHCAHRHHHHFHCDGCGKVYHIEGCPEGLRALVPKGFTMMRHEIMLYGNCDWCKNEFRSSKLT